jgi:hypothetical protein
MVAYAYDQIDQARTDLKTVSLKTTYETPAEPAGAVAFSEVRLSRMFVSESTIPKAALEALMGRAIPDERQRCPSSLAACPDLR